MVNKIIIVTVSTDEKFAFKSEKALFRWMRETKHVFADNETTGKQDRGIIISDEVSARKIKTVDYEGQLFSAKDPIDQMPK